MDALDLSKTEDLIKGKQERKGNGTLEIILILCLQVESGSSLKKVTLLEGEAKDA